jgi:L-asparaginase
MKVKGRKPRVAVIGTGGSISTPGRDSLDLFEYADHGRTIDVSELLAMFPETSRVADVVPISFRAVVSTAIAPRDWLDLVSCIHAVVDEDRSLDGIVITHGTATAEETAYFLHLTVKRDIPIVIVGAQRPPNGLSSDAGLNLVNAIRVAGSPAVRGLGVLLLLNDEIHAAREVTKTSNSRLQTFNSLEFGPLGLADPDGTIAIYRQPRRPHTTATPFDVGGLADLPPVAIVASYSGADGQLIRAAAIAGAKGIVIAALPPGLLPPAQYQTAVEVANSSTLIVIGNRSNAGRVIGRGKDVARKLVSGDNLNAYKARVLAMLALTKTSDPDEIRRMFETY